MATTALPPMMLVNPTISIIIGDWNSMISGLALHGLDQQAIEIFLDMENMEIEPDEITFWGLLSACSHGGLVVDGMYYFNLMRDAYNMVPTIQLYGCAIDLLGRVGWLKEVLQIIENAPLEADVLAWKAVLSAIVKHGAIVVGEEAAT
ncbi:Pentatricopeptide repeat [Dillenia turbinata]|uniref:Pentatricopeptide repeat n=1 Tax=Dillenia turbinata TaxID=194707 RepID=A0AAN8VAN6_9MAGN